MSDPNYDLIVIGAGPGGYVAAIRAAQLGMNVVVVEKRASLGGVCLNEGCIPSKALLDSSELFAVARDRFALHGIVIDPPRLDLKTMMKRKEEVVGKLAEGVSYLFRKNRIQHVCGIARLAGYNENGQHKVEVELRGEGLDMKNLPHQESGLPNCLTLAADKVLLATGSEAVSLPAIPFDGQVVVSASDALRFDHVPEHLVIAGGGAIGLELGSIWCRLGARVTIVEMLPNILPNMDRQLADALYRLLRKQGLQFRLGTSIAGLNKIGPKSIVQLNNGTGFEEMECDKLLVAVGRRPILAGLGLELYNAVIDTNGKLVVDADYQISASGIYAVGDLVPGPMLAHKASAEGIACVERMAGQHSDVEYDHMPGAVYTWPEAAFVGKTEEQLKDSGIAYRCGRFNFSAAGRARCMDETEGFIKMLADVETDQILGVHIIGPRASDLIAEAVAVMSFGGTSLDIAMTCHAHPTLPEALKEAALDVHKEAIHA